MDRRERYNKGFSDRLKEIEGNSKLAVLIVQSDVDKTADYVTPYIVYTDLTPDDEHEIIGYTVYVYTPFGNVDRQGDNHFDYVSRLYFSYDFWDKKFHITMMETPLKNQRSDGRSFQNLGLAQLALEGLDLLAQREQVISASALISTIDKETLPIIKHIFKKLRYQAEFKGEVGHVDKVYMAQES